MTSSMPRRRPTTTKPRSLPRLRRGEGSIWWDERRRQVVLEHRIGGRVYRERGDTPADVLDLRDARRVELVASAERTVELSDNGQITVATMLEEWLAFDCAGAPQTLDMYARSVRHVTEHLGDLRVCALRVGDVERMYAALVARPRRPFGQSSLIRVRSHLTMAFDFAVRRGYVKANIVRSSRLPRNAARPSKPTWLDRDGFIAMRRHLTATPSTHNTALLMTLLAGLRPGEVLGLRWKAVDLIAAVVSVESGLQRLQGGRRHHVIDELKTKAARRCVELPGDLVAALRRERAEQAARRMHAVHWADDSLVFTTATGRHLDPGNVRRACRAACRAIGIAERSPHKLRHSFASAALDAGLPVPAVARALGHSDGRMVVSTYGHSLDDLVATAAAMDRLSG
jgi:integrase